MFSYDPNRLIKNVDDHVVTVVVPSGVSLGKYVHQYIYVSLTK